MAKIMAKYLVVANTYGGGYGCELTCFGVFDSEEEALKFILDNPVQRVPSLCEDAYFDFFSGNTLVTLPYASKKRYAKSFIKKFDGSPIFLGGYVE